MSADASTVLVTGCAGFIGMHTTRALLAQGVRVGAGQQTGAGSTGQRGAGGGVPGSGY